MKHQSFTICGHLYLLGKHHLTITDLLDLVTLSLISDMSPTSTLMVSRLSGLVRSRHSWADWLGSASPPHPSILHTQPSLQQPPYYTTQPPLGPDTRPCHTTSYSYSVVTSPTWGQNILYQCMFSITSLIGSLSLCINFIIKLLLKINKITLITSK